ncbi:MAG TPA: site-specific integrase [Pseudonocardia sp.]|uniref:site-specific integrase n=1 Tax=Pseudonocardia sp. TaxID=60912 RepID=UPI002C503467|nr:site-specific integrase [Pseudonocardia sp.]HTF48426.1 site-specific integrase [Pseudonocardia sp.]
MPEPVDPPSEERDLRSLRLVRLGSVVATGDPREPFQLHDVDREVDWSVGEFVRHLVACDYSAASCRSYLLSLLRWLRFLSAVSVAWDRAERRDVRDFVLWMRGADNPQRQRRGGVLAGSVNGVTGKPELSEGYAPATINHALPAVRMFYAYHQLSGEGPVVNPVPVQQGRGCGRALAHRSPIEPVERLRRAAS